VNEVLARLEAIRVGLRRRQGSLLSATHQRNAKSPTTRRVQKKYQGRRKAKSLLKSRLLKFGSSDWTRTSSTSPVITAFVKYSHIFTNIFTIIIVFLW
jgi:hypothetical protein